MKKTAGRYERNAFDREKSLIMTKNKTRRRGSGSVYTRGNNWYISYYFNKKQIREKVGVIGIVTKAMAQQALDARLGEIAQGRFDLDKEVKSTFFHDLMERYIKFAESNFRAAIRVVHACNHFRKFFRINHLWKSQQ